jgi:anti-sigma regulatory factor (Ser/Thr protein kinase)
MSSVEISILNKIRDLAHVPELVGRLAAEHRLSADVVFGMNVALDEMLSNIIKYGFADDAIHEIHVRLSVSAAMVVVEIEDDGQPFDPLELPAPDVDAPLEERTVGGLGIHIVRNLMSEVEYARVAGRNRLIMKMPQHTVTEKGKNGTA